MNVPDGQKLTPEEYRQMVNDLKTENEALRHALEMQNDKVKLLTAITDNTLDMITLIDLEGKITFAGKAHKILGYEPDFLIGKNVMDFVHREDLPHVLEAYDAIVGSGNPSRIEYRCRCNDGSYLWIETRGVILLKEENNSKQKILLNSRDVTQRKQTEAEKIALEAQNQQLKKAESLGRMASAIAHHFNNQLQAVMGNIEIVMDDLQRDTGVLITLAEAMNAAHQASEISSLMLTYLGQTTGSHTSVDLSETCRKSLPLLQAGAPKGMFVKAEIPSPGPVILSNDSHIQQILTNLITNAWEAGSKQKQAVTLTVKTVSGGDISFENRFPIDWTPHRISYACLEVTDEGQGIAEQDIEKVFDPFFTKKFTGRGLGLSVVMGIVKAHDGGVTVESKPGRGSTFRVFLPISAEVISSPPARSEAPKAVKAEKVPGRIAGGTVLVVEDNEQVRKLAKSMLELMGYVILEAKDGLEAIEIFKQHQHEICCVLSDLTMPKMDGWETLAALRKLSPDIPVILSSGYDEAQVMEGEHIERPDAFIGKPYRRKDLGDVIERVLREKSGKVTE